MELQYTEIPTLDYKLKAHYKNIISLSAMVIVLHGCDKDSNNFEAFSNKLQNDFDISSQAMNDLKVVCSQKYVNCYVKREDAIMDYSNISLGEGFPKHYKQVSETKSARWNISNATITAKFQSSISGRSDFNIITYDTTKLDSFAADIDIEHRYDVSTSLEIKEVKGNPDGFSNLTFTASTQFDSQTLSQTEMNELFTSYQRDDGYDNAFTIVFISRDIPITLHNAEQNVFHETSTSFVETLPLQITNETMSELLDKTWY